jgi:hypothetical protein
MRPINNISKFGACKTDSLQVSAGLAAFIVLMMLVFPLLRRRSGDEYNEDPPIDGTGILHTVWLYRNHPRLEALLDQIEHPTNENLRAAGMVRTRLIGGLEDGYKFS